MNIIKAGRSPPSISPYLNVWGFIIMNGFKETRKGINKIHLAIADMEIVLDKNKALEYKNDCINILKWVDEVEKYLYKDN